MAKLKDSLAQFEAAFEAGRIGNRLQVDQARQALFGGQSGLLASRASFESRLDAFKQSMGLPPDLPVQVDEEYAEQFRLTDVKLVALQEYLSRCSCLSETRKRHLKKKTSWFSVDKPSR